MASSKASRIGEEYVNGAQVACWAFSDFGIGSGSKNTEKGNPTPPLTEAQNPDRQSQR